LNNRDFKIWVTDYWRSSKLVPFESLGVVSYTPSIATIAVSLTVYAIFSGKNSVTLKTGLGLFKVIENGAVRYTIIIWLSVGLPL